MLDRLFSTVFNTDQSLGMACQVPSMVEECTSQIPYRNDTYHREWSIACIVVWPDLPPSLPKAREQYRGSRSSHSV